MATNLNLDTQITEVENAPGIEAEWAAQVLALLRNLSHSRNNPFGNAATKDNGTAEGHVPLLGAGGVINAADLPAASLNSSGIVRIATAQEILDGKNPNIAVSPFNLQEKIANLPSPNDTALSGEPTAPTPPDGDNSTRIATTEFVVRSRNSLTDVCSSVITQHIYQASPTQPAPLTGIAATTPHGWSTTVPELALGAHQEIWSASRVLRIREPDPQAAADRRKTIEISGHTITVDAEIDVSPWSAISRWSGTGKNGKGLEWQGEWTPDTDYRSDETVQDVVGRLGHTYICVKPHRSAATFSEPSHWKLLARRGQAGEQGASFAWRSAWTAGHGHYGLRDTVAHDGRSWVCKQAHSADASHTPGTSGGTAYWDLLADRGAVGQEGPGQEYIYKRTKDHTRPATPVASSSAPDALPAGGWTNNALGVEVAWRWRYEWRAKRKKLHGVWQPFSAPELIAYDAGTAVSPTAQILWTGRRQGRRFKWNTPASTSVTGHFTGAVNSTVTITSTTPTGGSYSWSFRHTSTVTGGAVIFQTRQLSYGTEITVQQTVSGAEWQVIIKPDGNAERVLENLKHVILEEEEEEEEHEEDEEESGEL